MSRKIVFPGERLTVEEEYAPGYHAFSDEDGNVSSSIVGEASFDEESREVHVNPTRNQHVSIDVGTIVYGRVALVKDAVVILSIGRAEKNGEKRAIHDASAVLGVARASRDFIRSLKEHYKIGDIVKAKVSSITPYSIEVSTNEKGFGVICSRDEIIQKTIAGGEKLPVNPVVSMLEGE
ncbi:MAG: exosome complex RNA-binding protein Csl4 [Candidatus Diapherotrites archaeon]